MVGHRLLSIGHRLKIVNHRLDWLSTIGHRPQTTGRRLNSFWWHVMNYGLMPVEWRPQTIDSRPWGLQTITYWLNDRDWNLLVLDETCYSGSRVHGLLIRYHRQQTVDYIQSKLLIVGHKLETISHRLDRLTICHGLWMSYWSRNIYIIGSS